MAGDNSGYKVEEAFLWETGVVSDGWSKVSLVLSDTELRICVPEGGFTSFFSSGAPKGVIVLSQVEFCRTAEFMDIDPPHREDLDGHPAIKIRTTKKSYQPSNWCISFVDTFTRDQLLARLKQAVENRKRPITKSLRLENLSDHFYIWNLGTFTNGWMEVRYELTNTGLEWFKTYFDGVEASEPSGYIDYEDVLEITPVEEYDLAAAPVEYGPTKPVDIEGRHMCKITHLKPKENGQGGYVFSLATEDDRVSFLKELATRRTHVSREDSLVAAA
eukprot:CAMPEP_0119141414 /NCGR_PEP_ID=MMETSP1310-20130426/30990_1 /TAXON_ID=464262 /ORGANISM="Genus nov. species nov., Strain RCC2339" /LENGTH=273 /DNA_ID=CAMNT_0007132865 /DNA_START=90 /DNA_END=907 /DNA_ORIENTATION=+